MEDTKTRAVNSLITTWVLICLHCLEMYMLQNSGNCIWKRNVVLSSVHPLSYPLQPTLSHHLPYQFFIFSSLSLLNTNVIYYVPILNCNLKKIPVFIKPAGKWNFYAWVKEGLWCHYINCNLKSLMDRAFFLLLLLFLIYWLCKIILTYLSSRGKCPCWLENCRNIALKKTIPPNIWKYI